MKKALHLTLMAALAILLCIPSCTKPEKQIVGKWKIVYAKVDGYKVEEAEGEFWTFKDNGKFKGYLSLDDFEEVEFYCDWIIDGDELTLKGGDLECEEFEDIYIDLDIEQLDKENLVVSGKVKYNNGYYSGAYKVSYELERK